MLFNLMGRPHLKCTRMDTVMHDMGSLGRSHADSMRPGKPSDVWRGVVSRC